MIDMLVNSVTITRENYEYITDVIAAFYLLRLKFNFKLKVVDENIIYLNVDDKIQIPISHDEYFKLAQFIKEEKVDYIKEVKHDK